MSITSLVRRLERFTTDHSPEILTAFGVAGTLTTAFLTADATIKAMWMIEEEEQPQEDYFLEPREQFQLVWRLYIPPAVSAALTIGAIVGAAHVSRRRAAAMATAYTLTERAFSEYKEKVIEKVGEKKERAYRDEIAQDRVDENPLEDNVIVVTNNGDVLCYEHFTGRYFKSSMEALKQAENEINFQIIHDGYASVSDLYFLLGLSPTAFSEEVGWNTDYPLKIVYSTTLSEDNKPCISIDFDLHPRRKYAHYA